MSGAFDGRGRIALIASTAIGDTAARISPGERAGSVPPRARELLPGVWVAATPRPQSRFVYGVRNGRVSFVAVVSAARLRTAAQLRSDLEAAGLSGPTGLWH